MKRFYRTVEVVAAEDGEGFVVTLDGKPLNTPAKTRLVLPSRTLAEAVADEWQAQGDKVTPATLPLTRLASTAIDRVAPRPDAVVEEIAQYAGTDLVCYRAGHPPALVARQQAVWQPLLDWAVLRYDAPLTVTSGVLPLPQPAASLRALTAAVALHSPMMLAALHLATAACGSLVVALALTEGRLDADEAFAAAELDESFEIEQWGEDAEQTRRRALLREDIRLTERFVTLLRA